MSPDENIAIYRRVIEAVSAGTPEELDNLCAPDMVDHNPVPGQEPGLAGFKQWMSMARSAFPDLHGTIEDVLAAGDRVAGRVTWRGTHDGPFAGIPATGVPVAFEAFHIVRFDRGKVAEWWGVGDIMSVMQQLGVKLSAPES
jgi:steroid delta-isomerase-like uncharacterized protein